MEEKTRVIVVMSIKDAVMANFRIVVPGSRVIVVMRSRYTLCIKDAVMANFRIVVLDLWRKRQRDCGDEIEVYLMHKGCSNGKL